MCEGVHVYLQLLSYLCVCLFDLCEAYRDLYMQSYVGYSPCSYHVSLVWPLHHLKELQVNEHGPEEKNMIQISQSVVEEWCTRFRRNDVLQE